MWSRDLTSQIKKMLHHHFHKTYKQQIWQGSNLGCMAPIYHVGRSSDVLWQIKNVTYPLSHDLLASDLEKC